MPAAVSSNALLFFGSARFLSQNGYRKNIYLCTYIYIYIYSIYIYTRIHTSIGIYTCIERERETHVDTSADA